MRPLEPDDPRTIGDYRLLRRLGAGGMGRVYLGRTTGGRTVAVKVVHPHFAEQPDFRHRFHREIAAARRVQGTWTAPVLDADPDATIPWIATGYVAGPSLAQAIDHHGPLPLRTVRALGAGLAEALRAVHSADLLHRDVKPPNVLLAPDGPKLIDFGIARAREGTTTVTATGAAVGSPGFMSPEQVLAQPLTPATDLFSLGAVLAYAATGNAPFTGPNSAVLLYRVVHEQPQLDGLHNPLRHLIEGCLSKDPHHRPTPQQVIDYLTGPHTTPHTLTQNDWLPGPLADELSERASELARLETNGGDQAGTPAEVSADRATPVRPRDPREGPYDTPTQQITVAPRQRSPEPPAPPPAGPPEKRQRSDTPTPAGEGSAEPEPGGEARPRPWRRRLLVGAAALVLALLAAAVWWPGLWTGGKNANGDPDPSPSPTQAEGAVPGKFIGSWQGELTTRRGLPGGTLVVTLRQGREGQVVGTSKVSLAGASCPGKWVLKKATANRITVETRARDTAVCSGGSDREEATYRDGRLEFRSHDERGGRPTGTLERLE